MNKHFPWRELLLGLLLTTPLTLAANNPTDRLYYLPTGASSAAVVALLAEAKTNFETQEYEQAAANLERAIRIDPRNPILWHNLAGVRLKQQDWKRAASLADRSNALAVEDKWLRVRNWMIIVWACEGMGDAQCAIDARKRAEKLAS